MAKFDATKAIFAQVDVNRDGSIDRNEFNSWISNASSGFSSSLYESSTGGPVLNENMTSHARPSAYEASSQGGFQSAAGLNTPYTAAAASVSGNATVQTSSEQQTSQYLSQSVGNIYNDPNPQFVRRAAAGGPVTYKQRIFVRFLQPPALPPPGPLIIKEVRPPQPPPPPPLIVRQRAPPLPTLPPLILRERPPEPPASVASETVIRRLAALPPPPRSVIIERLPPLPPKPRDIIIERWIPYGPQSKRRTIVQRAPAAIQYPQPRNIIIVYDAVQARIVREFQRIGVAIENPQAYIARYGASLLDTATVVQQARAAGVVEDISPPALSSSTQFTSSASFNSGTGGTTTTGFSPSNATTNQSVSLTSATGAEAGVYGFEAANNGNTIYSSPNFIGDSAFAGNTGRGNTGFTAADINRDERLNQVEFQRFIQGNI